MKNKFKKFNKTTLFLIMILSSMFVLPIFLTSNTKTIENDSISQNSSVNSNSTTSWIDNYDNTVHLYLIIGLEKTPKERFVQKFFYNDRYDIQKAMKF